MYDDPPFDKARTFELLRKKSAAYARVHFAGGNDEGGVDSITLGLKLANGETEEHELEPWYCGGYTYQQGQYVRMSKPQTEDQELADQLARPVDEAYGSFAGDFYVDGTVTFDVEAGTVVMDKTETVPQDQHSELYL